MRCRFAAMDVYPDVGVDEPEEIFWRRVGPTDWTCDGCGNGVANVGVGFELARGGSVVAYMKIGQRCVTCGRMGSCSGWEEWNGLEIIDEV